MSFRIFVAALGGLVLAAPALAADKPVDFSGNWMTTEGIVPFTQTGPR